MIRKKSSMQQIADILGISKTAVFLALNGKSGVSDKTKEDVIRVAKEIQYISPEETIKSNKILVLIPEYIRNDSYFYNSIYWGIEKRAAEKGYSTIVTTVTDEMQQKCEMPPIYYDMPFSGIIMVGVLSEPYVGFLKEKNPYLLSIDQYYDSINITNVVTANLEGSCQLTTHVINCGHTKIGYVGSINTTSSLFDRWCGYQKALSAQNIPINPELSILDASPLQTLLSDPNELYKILLTKKELPTAYICGGDRIAFSLMEALNKLKIRVPEDISIAGFDDIELSKYVTPSLTTMHVHRTEMARSAVDLLCRQLKTGNSQPQKISLYTDLVIRESVNRI